MADIEMPWGVAMRLFKRQIVQRLQKEHKLSPKEAIALWDESIKQEDSRIRDILEDLTNANS